MFKRCSRCVLWLWLCLLLENQRVELDTLGTFAVDLLDERAEVSDVLEGCEYIDISR